MPNSGAMGSKRAARAAWNGPRMNMGACGSVYVDAEVHGLG